MAKKMDVWWRGEVVGSILEPQIDNYHLYGRWKSVPSPTADMFVENITAGKLETVVLGTRESDLRGYTDIPPEDGEIEFSTILASMT